MTAERALRVLPASSRLARHRRSSWAAALRRAWPRLRVLSMGLFFIAVAALLVHQARGIDWAEVGGVLRGYPASVLALALLPAVLSHAVYSSFDWVGRRWAGHDLPARQVVPVTFVSYAFNLNLGTLVGGFAFRYRLYSKLGLTNETITRVMAASLVTNWLGYLVLAGGVFAFGIVGPPDAWPIGALALRVLGAVLIASALLYLGVCPRSGKPRAWSLRGHRFELPSLRLALTQLVLSAINWTAIAAVLFVLFQQKLPYGQVLGTLLLAAVAGVVTHIPAGLGVLEAVFIAMLGHQLPRGELLAGLIAYRAIYYLLPLAVGVVVYGVLEARTASLARRPGPPKQIAAPAAHRSSRRR